MSVYGYPRPTGDIDIWIAVDPDNARRIVSALEAFGFRGPQLQAELFLDTTNMTSLGVPPVKIEILADISGVRFADCYTRRMIANVEGVEVPFIGADDLRANKTASGRAKDINDLENLP